MRFTKANLNSTLMTKRKTKLKNYNYSIILIINIVLRFELAIYLCQSKPENQVLI